MYCIKIEKATGKNWKLVQFDIGYSQSLSIKISICDRPGTWEKRLQSCTCQDSAGCCCSPTLTATPWSDLSVWSCQLWPWQRARMWLLLWAAVPPFCLWSPSCPGKKKWHIWRTLPHRHSLLQVSQDVLVHGDKDTRDLPPPLLNPLPWGVARAHAVLRTWQAEPAQARCPSFHRSWCSLPGCRPLNTRWSCLWTEKKERPCFSWSLGQGCWSAGFGFTIPLPVQT